MSEAPERIEAILDRCMKVQPKTLNEPHAHLRAMMRLAITEAIAAVAQYIRADIHEARVKELEEELAEVLKKIGDLDKFIERLTST